MHRLKFVLAGLLFTTPALAQDATVEGEASAGASVEAGAEVNAGAEGGASMEGSASAEVTAMVNSKSAIDWRLLPNKGKIGAYGAFSVLRLSFDDGMGNSASATADGFGIGAAYGITDKIAVGAQYAVTLGLFDADSEFAGPLDIFGQFDIMTDDKLHLTASADFEFDLCGGRDTMGDCVSSKAIHAGLGARYKLTPKMAVFTGAPYGPGPVGQHLSISLEDSGPISFSLPVGFMFQATPELNINAQTSLGTIAINDSAGDSAFIGADFFALSLGGLFAVNEQIAVEASIALPDLKEIGFDIMVFSVGARLRL